MVRNLALSSSAALLCLLTAGCDPASAPGDDPSEPALALPSPQASASEDDPCGATQLAALRNSRASPILRKTVARFAGTAPVRWIAPGTAVTADYHAARINLILDDSGRIASIRCG